MIVDPNAKLEGSTSVACWVLEFVNGSELSFTNGVVAGGKFEPEPLEPLFHGKKDPGPEPQLKLAAMTHAAAKYLTADFTNISPSLRAVTVPPKLAGVQERVNAGLNARC